MQSNNENKDGNLEQGPLMPLSDARILLDMVCLINALLKSEGNMSHAAEELGIVRRTIYELMERYGISYNNDMLCIKVTPLIQYLEIAAPYVEKYLP